MAKGYKITAEKQMSCDDQNKRDSRSSREIEHGIKLAKNDTEFVWGWGSPAGKLRAARRAGLIANSAGLNNQSQALEIGCGTGLFTEMFAKTGARLVAVDISGELLQKAQQRDLPPLQVRFIEKRFEDCALEGPFDAVIGSSVLHHLDLLPSCLKIFSLLKPGGIMAFAEPNLLNPQVFLERTFRKWFPYISRDETAFLRWRLKRVLLESGFENVKIIPFDWLHPATPEKLAALIQRFGFVVEKIPVFREFAGSLLIAALRPPPG
jgi:2-polyprenyl-3-methyl-5-hydroxy-6-metoxy-1,4-benzoquinol methylase